MADYTSKASRCIYAIQTTDDVTRETPDHHLATFVSESFQLNQSHISSNALGSGRLTEAGFSVGNRAPGGQLAGELIPESMGEMFKAWMGANVTAGASPYTHTSTPGAPLPAVTIQTIPIDSSDGTERPKDLIGAKCASWQVNCDATGDGAMVTWTSDWLAHNLLTTQSAIAASLPTPTHLTSVQASLTLAGAAYCVDSFSFGGNNNLRTVTKACVATAGKPTISDEGIRVYTANVVADFTDYTEHDYIAAGTQVALVFTISASANKKLVSTWNVRTVGDTPIIPGPGVIKQPLSFVGTGSAPISNVLTNLDATA